MESCCDVFCLNLKHDCCSFILNKINVMSEKQNKNRLEENKGSSFGLLEQDWRRKIDFHKERMHGHLLI